MTTTTELEPAWLDVTRVAIASFLARYREPTLTAYTLDLKAFLGWCQTNELKVLRVTRGHLELYLRHLEGRGYAPATVARRFGTVAAPAFGRFMVTIQKRSTCRFRTVPRNRARQVSSTRTLLAAISIADSNVVQGIQVHG